MDGHSGCLPSHKLSSDSAPASVAGEDVAHSSLEKTVEETSSSPKEASSVLDKQTLALKAGNSLPAKPLPPCTLLLKGPPKENTSVNEDKEVVGGDERSCERQEVNERTELSGQRPLQCGKSSVSS